MRKGEWEGEKREWYSGTQRWKVEKGNRRVRIERGDSRRKQMANFTVS